MKRFLKITDMLNPQSGELYNYYIPALEEFERKQNQWKNTVSSIGEKKRNESNEGKKDKKENEVESKGEKEGKLPGKYMVYVEDEDDKNITKKDNEEPE